MAVPAVDIQGVTHRYGTHRALRNVTLQVAPSTLYGLLGPNGSGKTTLFRVLSTLMPPSEGRARVFGLDTAREPGAVRRRIGTVFQDEALDEGLRRRVDLARGLLHQPDLLLLDEPTSGLDPAARRTFWTAMQRLRTAEGTTLLVATHLMDEAERCDRVGILSDGTLVADGAPDALKADLGDETLWLETDAPTLLRDRIEAQFGVPTRIVGATVQVAPSDPPTFLSALYEVLGDRIRSATLRTPTLEDVFMVHAGVSPDESRERVLARTEETEDQA
ncbi:MAG: ABC transporter ATP-binding protein [Bacteroidetes bacterium QH_2_63_10]|nr:MAG: ABC transporter ATP-binding protein [Bacteroidetes bacterium QH_2_63_10]